MTDTTATNDRLSARAAELACQLGRRHGVDVEDEIADGGQDHDADPAPGHTVTFPTTNEVKFTFPPGPKNFARLKATQN